MSKIYACTSLTGGGAGALDSIDGDLLSDLDAALVVTLTDNYTYSLDADSGAAESSPSVIAPDTNPGTKRWILSAVQLVKADVEALGVSHTSLTDIGTNTHAQIDTAVSNSVSHIASTANPHSVDEGDILPDQTGNSGKFLSTDGSNSSWQTAGGFPSGAIILVESDSAISGFTLLTDNDDKLVYITKGSGASGEAGGTNKSGSTWTQPNHTHTGPSHVHSGPSHLHMWWNYVDMTNNDQTANSGGTLTTITDANNNVNNNKAGMCTKATSGGDYIMNMDGYTTAAGTGDTGAGGTGATGGGATANTWRPTGRNFTRQQKT